MNCDTCRYSGLCKYEDDARKFETYILDQAKQEPAKEPETISVIIHCTKYWGVPTTTTKRPL